ncbi:hypothetical protein THRCLA_06685, partial [Thraustotheca clavata]
MMREGRQWLMLLLCLGQAASLPWEPSVCGGSLVTDSSEPGCHVNQCQCLGYISQCDASYNCNYNVLPGMEPMCLGRCRLSVLGELSNILGLCLILGCPLLVLIYHFQSFKKANATIDHDTHEADVDHEDNELVEQIQHENLLERVILHSRMHEIGEHLIDNVTTAIHAGGSAMAALVHAQAETGLMSVAPRTSAAMTDSNMDIISVQRQITTLPRNIANSIDNYIDVTKMSRLMSRHRAVVINIHPQIYLETIPKNTLRWLLFIICLLVAINIGVVVAQVSFIPFDFTISRSNGVNASCGSRPCAEASWIVENDTNHTISFRNTWLPQTPDVVRLSMKLEPSVNLTPGVKRLGLYTLRMTADNERTILVPDYTNDIVTTCTCHDKSPSCLNVDCTPIDLVGIFMKKYGASLFDVRKQQYTIELNLEKEIPFKLEFQAMLNGYEFAGLAAKAIMGFSTIGILIHYIYVLNVHHRQTRAKQAALTPIYRRFFYHLSLERKLMAIILFSLAIQTNPVSVLVTLPWFGAASTHYIIFRSVWETLVYAIALGSLLTIIDSYRKHNHQSFKNGAAIAFLGKRFLIVKSFLVIFFLSARVALVVTMATRFQSTTNIDLVLATSDTVMIVLGVAILASVCLNVSAQLRRRRYSETRYQSLAFRFMSLVAYGLLAVLLINVVFFSAYAVVSAFKPTFVRQTSVMTECTFTGLIYITTIIFYPPTKLKSDQAVPRGYVIREIRQFAMTPQELSPTPTLATDLISSPSITTPSNDSPIDGLFKPRLTRSEGFRCKPITTPHRIFCLESACRLFNASRLAYYRSTLYVNQDIGDDGFPIYDASKYCNQEALARDEVHEAAHLYDKGTDTHCLVLQGESKIIFAFRGTASKANVKTDFEIALDPHPWPASEPGVNSGYAHRGFLAAYNTIRSRVHETLKGVFAEYKLYGYSPETHLQIYTTGHSLGGALATIAALDLKLTFHQRIIMYNFGSPRVGCHNFAAYFNKEV